MNKISVFITRGVYSLLVIVGAGLLYSCEKYSYNPPAVDPNATYSLSKDIQPLFNANCITCHGGRVTPDLREGKSYTSLTRGGYVQKPAENSRLYVQITTDPDHKKILTETEKLRIRYWIEQGAKNN